MGRYKIRAEVFFVQFPVHSYFPGSVIFPVTGTASHRNPRKGNFVIVTFRAVVSRSEREATPTTHRDTTLHSFHPSLPRKEFHR